MRKIMSFWARHRILTGSLLATPAILISTAGMAYCSSKPSVPGMFTQQDTSHLYEERTFGSLMRSFMVFKACQSQWLVDIAPHVLSGSKSVPGLASLVNWIVKETFFKQFCGGETSVEVRPVMQELKQRGVGSILDLSVESSDQSPSEERVLHVLELIRDCIDTASFQPGTFVAIKMSALGSPQSLRSVSGMLTFTRDLFNYYSTAASADIGKRYLDFQGFKQMMHWMPAPIQSQEELDSLFKQADSESTGKISWNQFNSVLGLDKRPQLYIGKIPNPPSDKNPLLHNSNGSKWSISDKYQPETTQQDVEEVERIKQRLSDLCQFALSKNVKLMFDAEQSYFQAAIDHLSLQMMKKYNAITRPSTQPPGQPAEAFVYNTYQMYLKDGMERLKSDYELAVAMQEQFVFAVKLVRGAYMTSERQRASSLDLIDPINPTVDDTHRQYDQAVKYMLAESDLENPITICIASHNRQSIASACDYLEQMKREGRDEGSDIWFAQLYGMHDHTTHTLAVNGYKVFKYLPYGPVEDVIPYLLRRAQENRAIFADGSDLGAQQLSDRNLLWLEIKKRFGFNSNNNSKSV